MSEQTIVQRTNDTTSNLERRYRRSAKTSSFESRFVVSNNELRTSDTFVYRCTYRTSVERVNLG